MPVTTIRLQIDASWSGTMGYFKTLLFSYIIIILKLSIINKPTRFKIAFCTRWSTICGLLRYIDLTISVTGICTDDWNVQLFFSWHRAGCVIASIMALKYITTNNDYSVLQHHYGFKVLYLINSTLHTHTIMILNKRTHHLKVICILYKATHHIVTFSDASMAEDSTHQRLTGDYIFRWMLIVFLTYCVNTLEMFGDHNNKF